MRIVTCPCIGPVGYKTETTGGEAWTILVLKIWGIINRSYPNGLINTYSKAFTLFSRFGGHYYHSVQCSWTIKSGCCSTLQYWKRFKIIRVKIFKLVTPVGPIFATNIIVQDYSVHNKNWLGVLIKGGVTSYRYSRSAKCTPWGSANLYTCRFSLHCVYRVDLDHLRNFISLNFRNCIAKCSFFPFDTQSRYYDFFQLTGIFLHSDINGIWVTNSKGLGFHTNVREN